MPFIRRLNQVTRLGYLCLINFVFSNFLSNITPSSRHRASVKYVAPTYAMMVEDSVTWKLKRYGSISLLCPDGIGDVLFQFGGIFLLRNSFFGRRHGGGGRPFPYCRPPSHFICKFLFCHGYDSMNQGSIYCP